MAPFGCFILLLVAGLVFLFTIQIPNCVVVGSKFPIIVYNLLFVYLVVLAGLVFLCTIQIPNCVVVGSKFPIALCLNLLVILSEISVGIILMEKCNLYVLVISVLLWHCLFGSKSQIICCAK